MNKTLHQILLAKYPPAECIILREVADSSSGRRYLDYMVVNLWESRGQAIIGIEVKSYRGDWIKEMKTPEKQELHVPYCDYFYLLITDEKVAKIEEVPENWGLMVVKNEKIFIVKKAPKLKAVQMPKQLMMGMLRRAANKDGYILKEDIKETIKLKVEEAVKNQGYDRDRRLREYEKLVKIRDELSQEIGFDIFSTWRKPKEIGEKLKYLLNHDFGELLEQLKRLNESATSLAERSKIGLDLLSEPEKQ